MKKKLPKKTIKKITKRITFDPRPEVREKCRNHQKDNSKAGGQTECGQNLSVRFAEIRRDDIADSVDVDSYFSHEINCSKK